MACVEPFVVEDIVPAARAESVVSAPITPVGVTVAAAREWQQSLPRPFNAIPFELLAVCGLMALAGLLTLWPVLSSLPDTFSLLGAGGYASDLGLLLLIAWIMLAFFGGACLLLAWRLAHADRVARGLSYVLLGGLASSILVGNVHDISLILVMLASCAGIGVLWFAPGVREFFAGVSAPAGRQPVSIVVARTLVAVWGACLVLNGLLFLPISDLGGGYLPVGGLLIVIGACAFVVNQRIGDGNEVGRRVASAGAVVYAVLLVILGRRDPGLLLPLALIAGVVWNLWVPSEARDFFDRGPSQPPRSSRSSHDSGLSEDATIRGRLTRFRGALMGPGSVGGSTDVSARLRRLQADYDLVRERFSDHPHVSVEAVGTDLPPDTYRVEFRVRGLFLDGEQPEYRDVHQVEITLPRCYPDEKPYVVPLTPIFHPNVRDYYYIADYWAAGTTLADVIIRLGDIIQWRAYSFDGPLDGIAAKWAIEQEPTGLFPIGNVGLGIEARTKRPDISDRLAESAVATATPSASASGESDLTIRAEPDDAVTSSVRSFDETERSTSDAP